MCWIKEIVITWCNLKLQQYLCKSLQDQRISCFTFTPTVHPIVWGGRVMEEPLIIRWTRDVFPTPTKRLRIEDKYLKCKRYSKQVRAKEFYRYNKATVISWKHHNLPRCLDMLSRVLICSILMESLEALDKNLQHEIDTDIAHPSCMESCHARSVPEI